MDVVIVAPEPGAAPAHRCSPAPNGGNGARDGTVAHVATAVPHADVRPAETPSGRPSERPELRLVGAGDRLRLAREERGLDLDRVSAETGIERRFIEALEREAPLEDFPGAMYARMFLREYARYLGLKAKPLLDSYRAAHPEPEHPLINPRTPIRVAPRWVAPVLAVGSLVILALMAVAVVRATGRAPAARPSPIAASPQPTVSPVPAQTEPAAAQPAVEPAERLVVRVTGERAWLRVARGPDVLLEGTEDRGFQRAFRPGPGLEVVIGDAGAVRVGPEDGRLRSLGGPGEVFQGRLVLRDGRMRVAG